MSLPASLAKRNTQYAKLLGLLFGLFLFLFAFVSPARAALDLEGIVRGLSAPEYPMEQHDANAIVNGAGIIYLGIAGCPPEIASCPQQFKYGAVHSVSSAIAGLYSTPPASGVYYAQDILQKFDLVKPAYAQQQGTGFQALQPLLPIWRAFRNFAYLLFVIIFVATGLAIMFRVKISPQAAITIQSALPRLVVALILVTFSYAIVGFLIDLIYVFISITILVFGGTAGDTAQLQSDFLTGGLGHTVGAMFSLIEVRSHLTLLFAAIGSIVGAAAGIAWLGPAALPVIGGLALGALIGALALAILVLYLAFRLLIELIKAYVGILIAVILAPLQLLLGALPLGGLGFGNWFKGLLVNIMIFPAVAFVLLLGRALIEQIRISATQAGTTDMWGPPLLGGGDTSILSAIIGIGILLIVYRVPEGIRQLMKVEAFPFGTGLGEPLGVITRPGGAISRSSVGGATQQIYGGLPPGRLKRGVGVLRGAMTWARWWTP